MIYLDTAALVKLIRVEAESAALVGWLNGHPDQSVRATAGAYVEPELRSLDAIHLATAELLVASGQPLQAFVTYDKRLAGAASSAGLPVHAPS